MSSGMICGARWGDCLGTRPVRNDFSPCVSTLGGDTGAASGVSSGIFTLGGDVTCGGAALLEVSDSYLKADFLFSPDILSGLVGVGLRRAWVRSVAESFAASFGEVLGNVRVSVEISAVSETISLDVL